MLSKKHRFPLTTEFDRIKKEGRMVNGPLFGLLVVKRATGDSPRRPSGSGQTLLPRFGFIISTKIDKRSVVRHRIKRLLAEAVRLNLGKIKSGYDLIFLAKKSIVGKSFEEVKKEVMNCLVKANMFV